MANKIVLKNSSSAAVYTAKCHYLFEGHKVFEYQTEADLLNGPGTYGKGLEWIECFTIAVRIWDYCAGN